MNDVSGGGHTDCRLYAVTRVEDDAMADMAGH